MASIATGRAKIGRDFTAKFLALSLTGISVKHDDFLAERTTTIRRVRMVYTRAAAISGSVGVTLMLGTLSSPNKFAVWNTATSASEGTVVEIKISTTHNVLAVGEVLSLRVGTGKTNAGTVNVQVECVEV